MIAESWAKLMNIVIKRYSNRKLYDTFSRCYITLEGVARLIRQGNTVKIIDNETEEDLTAVTLMQIILEQERKKVGLLPVALLMGWIQSGENLAFELGIPTRDDILRLKTHLEILEEKLRHL